MTNVTVQEALKAAQKVICEGIYSDDGMDGEDGQKALLAIDAALSEIDKCEPVAWMLDHIPNKGYMKITHIKDYADKEMGKTIKNNPNGFGQKYGCYPYDICIPIYDKPQPREWVGLSEEDIRGLVVAQNNARLIEDCLPDDLQKLADAITAKLKQLNTKG